MKTIEFIQYDRCSRNITIQITDDELFKQRVDEWIEEEGCLNYWDLEELHFEDCVITEYGDWENGGDENNDNFYQEMSKIGIETDPE